MAGKDLVQYRPPGQLDDPDSLAAKGDLNYERPVLVGATGDPGTIANGSPGAFSVFSWTQNTNRLYDAYNMITSNPEHIKIPIDGFYDIFVAIESIDVPSFDTEIEFGWQVGDSSDSGFSSPTFTDRGSRFSKTFFPAKSLDNYFQFLLRGIELHLADVLRLRVRIYGPDDYTQTTAVNLEMMYSYSIPSVQTRL